jgi:hypothetical protein
MTMEKAVKTIAVLNMRIDEHIQHHTAEDVETLFALLKATQAEKHVDYHVFTCEVVSA